MAAIFSASSATGKTGARTMVIEANKSPGQKLLLTGGGRCNLTHLAAAQEIARAFGPKGRFLSYSLHKFLPTDVRQFFRKYGLESKVDQTGCVFPASDRASDVRDVLFTEAKKLGVRFIFSTKVKSIAKHGEYFTIGRAARQKILAEKVIIATGGLSYPPTGSTGDGYKFARHFGHTIIEPRASLVPLVTHEKWPSELAGTSLDNVKITASFGKKKTVLSRVEGIVTAGALLFTHDGISGPAALEMSRFATDFLPNEKKPLKITIDLISDIDETELERMILKQISEHSKKTVANILAEMVPRRISQILYRQLNLTAELYANQLNKDIRKKLLHLLKATPLSIVRTRPIAEAMVTRGGVSTAEIESKTMESKICRGLYFAGEVIDVDGPCGGYNLQMCWSTGALAGLSAGQSK